MHDTETHTLETLMYPLFLQPQKSLLFSLQVPTGTFSTQSCFTCASIALGEYASPFFGDHPWPTQLPTELLLIPASLLELESELVYLLDLDRVCLSDHHLQGALFLQTQRCRSQSSAGVVPSTLVYSGIFVTLDTWVGSGKNILLYIIDGHVGGCDSHGQSHVSPLNTELSPSWRTDMVGNPVETFPQRKPIIRSDIKPHKYEYSTLNILPRADNVFFELNSLFRRRTPSWHQNCSADCPCGVMASHQDTKPAQSRK